MLKKNQEAIGWALCDLKSISPSYCIHKIYMEKYYKPIAQPQRQLNPTMKEVVKKEVKKLLKAGMIFPILDSAWVSPVQMVPKKGGMTVIHNEKNELIPIRKVTRWRMCIDWVEDHFPLTFINQVLERLLGKVYYYFWIVIQGIIKLWLIQKIKRKLFLLVLLVFLLIEKCHLDYVTLKPVSSNACLLYL